MTVTIKIPKIKTEKTSIQVLRKNIEQKFTYERENQVQMEIIKLEEYNRVNIKFTGGIPSERVREILKISGWIYNSKEQIWYPKGHAIKDSYNFAKSIQKEFF